jgi:hypothetical protein
MAMLYQEVHAGKKTRKYSMAGWFRPSIEPQ